MIKIININRKVRSEGEQGDLLLKVTGANCNAVIATDEHYNRGHFSLTDQESEEFDLLARKIEDRIARDIADEYVGLAGAVQPEQAKAASTS